MILSLTMADIPQVRLHDTHLLVHGRHVPHIADDGPAGHHPQQVTDHAVLGAVPESISKLWVVLKKKKKDWQTTKHWAQAKENLRYPVRNISIPSFSTFMATGYMVAPISKLPFLNIMTDVLLMQVPEKRPRYQWGQSYEMSAQLSGHTEAELRPDRKRFNIKLMWGMQNQLPHTYPLEILILEALSCHSRDPSTWRQHEEIKDSFIFCIKMHKGENNFWNEY